MGCMCCSLSSFVSIVLHACERISMCTVCALLVCCLLFTIMAVLILGVGIGYHYCFVQNSVDAMAKAAKAAGDLRTGKVSQREGSVRVADEARRRGIAHKVMRREADNLLPTSNNLTELLNEHLPIPNSTSYL